MDDLPADDLTPLPARAADLARAALPKPAASSAPSFLGIDPKRLVEITEQACRRIDDCRAEMGLSFGQPIANGGTWAWDRQVARVMYQGNMEHRRAMNNGNTVFDQNNWSLNIPSRIIRMLAAQHSGDLVGADPFCAVMPEKFDDPSDEKLSKQAEKKIQDEITRSNMRMVIAESIRVALIEGERPIKVTYDSDQTQFIGDATVMVQASPDLGSIPNLPDSDDDEGPAAAPAPTDPTEPPVSPPAANLIPVKTPSGDYIFLKDEFLRFYIDAAGQSLGVAPIDDPENPAPLPPDAVGIQLRLKKEPAFILQGRPQYALVKNLQQTITHRKGLNVAGLFCEDFLYPPKCPSLRDPSCDIMVHCYDEPLDSMTARYRNAGYAEQYSPLRETSALSQASQPNREAGEDYQGSSRKMVNVHEGYYRCRVNEDDLLESWIFIVIDFQQRIPVYAEYLGNMKMKRPPFVLLRGVESEPGRAYGVGVYKKFADKNLAIDVWFNRAALKSSKTSSLTFQHEDGWKAEYQGQELIIGGDEIYKIPASQSDTYGPNHPPVFRVNLNEMSDKEFELMEKLIQDGDLSFGVVNTAPEISQQVGKGTATAVRNVERTGNILQRSTEEMMAADIEEILELVADTVLENLDEESVEWIPGEDQLAMLNRDEIRNLPRDVRVLLTKAKGEENLATNQQASQIVEAYYGKPLWLRAKIRTFVVGQLKSLFIQDADQVIEDPTPEQLKQEAQSQQSPPTEIEKLSIDLKDLGPLTPAERQQGLSLFNITASSPAPAGAPPSPTDQQPSPTPQPAPAINKLS